MSTNRYGVDVDYFYKIIKRELTDLSSHTPDELARVLARMSVTADSGVFKEPEFQGTNTDMEEAQAQVKALTSALLTIRDIAAGYPRDVAILNLARKALSSPPIELYKAARAVIDAVNFNSGTLTIIAQGGHFGGETVVHILKLNTTLQELEQSNAGGER